MIRKVFIILAMAALMLPLISASAIAILDWEADYGTALGQNDDDCDYIKLDFFFEFYGTNYDGVWVNSNGNMTFDKCNTDYWHTNIPDEDNLIIAPLYGDFSPDIYGGMYYNTLGTAPNRRFVVTWEVVPESCAVPPCDPSLVNTFQVQLYESSNQIQFGYNGLTTDGLNWYGQAMNVGISSSAGDYINSASGNDISALDNTNLCYEPIDGEYLDYYDACSITVEVRDCVAFFNNAVEDGAIYGRGRIRWLANARLWIFGQMLESVQRSLENDNTKRACNRLNRIDRRCDGDRIPRDFIDGNADAMGTLTEMLDDLATSLECE